jgi:hypothetical protein
MGEQAVEGLVYYGDKAEAKNGGLTVHVANHTDPFFLRSGSFPVPVACRRTNFPPIRATDASEYPSRMRGMASSQLLKGRKEKF